MAMLVYHKLTIGFMAMSTYDLGSPWIQYLISQRSTAVLEKKNIHGDSANLPIGGVHGISIEWEFITSDEDRIYRTRVTVQGGWLTPHGNKHTHTHPTVLTLNQGIFQELQKEVLSYIALG